MNSKDPCHRLIAEYQTNQISDEGFEELQTSIKESSAAPTYRTFRLNADVQIWMTEGRDYFLPTAWETVRTKLNGEMSSESGWSAP
jgi:hypothetical protein